MLRAQADSGYSFLSSSSFEILALDKADGKINYRQSDTVCNGEQWVPYIKPDSSRFVIEDGRLYVFQEGSCLAQALTGSAAGLIGKWNTLAGKTVLPENIRSPACRFYP